MSGRDWDNRERKERKWKKKMRKGRWKEGF